MTEPGSSTHQPRISPPAGGGQGMFFDTPLDFEIEEFARVAMRALELDPLVTEVVRLRCAEYHDCRVCSSLRIADAVAEGLDEEMRAEIRDYEHSELEERLKVALRYVDTIIADPNGLDADLRAELRSHFSASQIAEMSFDVMKWSFQKALVALRLEQPPWEGLASLSFDEVGETVIETGLLTG